MSERISEKIETPEANYIRASMGDYGMRIGRVLYIGFEDGLNGIPSAKPDEQSESRDESREGRNILLNYKLSARFSGKIDIDIVTTDSPSKNLQGEEIQI